MQLHLGAGSPSPLVKSGSPFPDRGEGNTFTREIYNLFLGRKG